MREGDSLTGSNGINAIPAKATQTNATISVKDDMCGPLLIYSETLFIVECGRKRNSRFEIMQGEFSYFEITQPIVF